MILCGRRRSRCQQVILNFLEAFHHNQILCILQTLKITSTFSVLTKRHLCLKGPGWITDSSSLKTQQFRVFCLAFYISWCTCVLLWSPALWYIQDMDIWHCLFEIHKTYPEKLSLQHTLLLNPNLKINGTFKYATYKYTGYQWGHVQLPCKYHDVCWLLNMNLDPSRVLHFVSSPSFLSLGCERVVPATNIHYRSDWCICCPRSSLPPQKFTATQYWFLCLSHVLRVLQTL